MALARSMGIGKISFLKQAVTLWQSQNFFLTYASKKGSLFLWTREACMLLCKSLCGSRGLLGSAAFWLLNHRKESSLKYRQIPSP